jgi:hypothetical protein
MDLLREQTKALKLQAETAGKHLDVLERQRREDRQPVFVWRLDRYEPMPVSANVADQRLIYVNTFLQALNEGAHAMASNLQVSATLSERHEPPTLHRLVPIGGDVTVRVIFGPLRQDVDFSWTGSCSIDLRPLGSAEVAPLRVEFRGRIWPDNLTFEIFEPPA